MKSSQSVDYQNNRADGLKKTNPLWLRFSGCRSRSSFQLKLSLQSHHLIQANIHSPEKQIKTIYTFYRFARFLKRIFLSLLSMVPGVYAVSKVTSLRLDLSGTSMEDSLHEGSKTEETDSFQIWENQCLLFPGILPKLLSILGI